MSLLTRVSLTDRELILLDGQCSEDVQLEINNAKERLSESNRLSGVPEKFHAILLHMVEEAKTNGILVVKSHSIRHCDICGRSGTYQTYKRSSKYHRKGDYDYGKPIHLWGYEFAERFVIMDGHPTLGCCGGCAEELFKYTPSVLNGIEAEMPEKLTGVKPKYKKSQNVICSCGWSGHKEQMLDAYGLMGNKYKGKCPECKNEYTTKYADEFVVVEMKDEG